MQTEKVWHFFSQFFPFWSLEGNQMVA